MKPRAWSSVEVPDQRGRCAIVTGANGGLGLATAGVLLARGARVIMACRNLAKAESAAEALRAAHPGAELEVRHLDLADLASVRAFVHGLRAHHPAVHLLVNNAGVMAIPRAETRDGFEAQLGVNHLGHYALTGLLMPELRAAASARVVTVSSTAHKAGRLYFDDPHLHARYGDVRAYCQSKLANLLFAFELDRRLRATGLGMSSVACHPGYADTELMHIGPRLRDSAFRKAFFKLGARVLAQTPERGAQSILRAATDPTVRGGEYFGPSGPGELFGPPVRVEPGRAATDPATARRLWDWSAAQTGIDFDLPAG